MSFIFDVQECVIPAGGAEKIVSYINDVVIEELRECYPGIISKNVRALSMALSLIREKTGNLFVFIIDEWNFLIRDDANNQKVQKEYIDFLRSIFKGTQASRNIALAYITGILPIIIEKTQSALNNFNEYTVLDAGPFAKYVGFTENEVRALSKKYNVDFNLVNLWYDGYLLDGYHVYNPRAVVSVMLSGKFKSYWSKTANYDLVVPLINMDYKGLKADIITMISGSEVDVDVNTFKNDTISFSSKDDVLTYLIHLGYLAYNEEKETAFIPNEEIREEMTCAVNSTEWDEMISFTKESDSILKATLNKDGRAVEKGLERVHGEYVPSVKYNDENSLSCVLTIAYLSSMRYYLNPIRELPTEKGFSDLVYIPKPKFKEKFPELVVELKWDKDAKSAIDQIKEKKYPESIKEYTDNILLVGINYDKKTKKHECIIEELYFFS